MTIARIVPLVGATLAAVLAASAAATPAKAVIYYITTGQQGAQTQIDQNHTSAWIIQPGAGFDLGGGNFEMKEGPSTVADIMLSLYLGSDASGQLLAQVFYTRDEFCAAHGGNCQTFASTPFHFDTDPNTPGNQPFTLLAGNTYFAALTSSAAPDQQNAAYFIKGLSDAVIQGPDGEPPPGGDDGDPTPIPEPGTLALLGAGLLGVAAFRRRR